MPVTITMAGSFTQPVLQVLDEQVAAFEAANRDLKVEIVRMPKDAERRRAAVAEQLGSGDSSIDLYVLESGWAAELAASGGLLSLDGYLTSAGASTATVLPGALKADTFGGQILALPWSVDAGLLYYRRDLLERLGYEPPVSWAELQQVALAGKQREGLGYGYLWPGTAGDTLTCITLEWIWSADPAAAAEGLRPAFDHPGAQTALQQMAGLITSGASPPDLAAYGEGQVLETFMKGDALFMRGGFSAWDYLNSQDSPVADQVGIAPLPESCLAGKALALSVRSLHPDKAWRFATFLVGTEQQVEMAQAAHQPPADEAAYHDASLLQAYPVLEPLRHALSAARSRSPDPGYAIGSAAVAVEVNRMLSGEQDAAATIGAIRSRLAAIPSP